MVYSAPPHRFIAAVQATEAIKIITHSFASSSVRKTLLYVDLWDNVFQEHSIVKLPAALCAAERISMEADKEKIGSDVLL